MDIGTVGLYLVNRDLYAGDVEELFQYTPIAGVIEHEAFLTDETVRNAFLTHMGNAEDDLPFVLVGNTKFIKALSVLLGVSISDTPVIAVTLASDGFNLHAYSPIS